MVFTVGATGVPAPTYQWRLNGVNIPAATSATLVLDNVQPKDAGHYSVAVKNSLGTVNSAAAEIEVLVPWLPFADMFADRGILYAPDYVINAGGIINVGMEFAEGGYNEKNALHHIERIPEALKEVWTIARDERIPPSDAADKLAERILADARGKKKGASCGVPPAGQPRRTGNPYVHRPKAKSRQLKITKPRRSSFEKRPLTKRAGGNTS